MAITINTNMAAARASFQLSKNNAALNKSLNRLSSGSRITTPADDAGGLAVAMKLKGSINRLKGVEANVGNAISFLQVQDGILESAGKIVDRMAELKALSQDVLKNSGDIANYDSEFKNLQVQLHSMASSKFNGVSLFGANGTFGTVSDAKMKEIVTSADGSVKVSINQSLLLSALTINTASGQVSVGANFNDAQDYSNKNTGQVRSFAATSTDTALALSVCDAAVYTQALENIATLRAANGGSVSRLMFAEEAAQQRRTNLEAAHGRIMDVDIAQESTALAKHSILVQASASMLSQANQSANIALSLLG
jgi:flagellin